MGVRHIKIPQTVLSPKIVKAPFVLFPHPLQACFVLILSLQQAWHLLCAVAVFCYISVFPCVLTIHRGSSCLLWACEDKPLKELGQAICGDLNFGFMSMPCQSTQGSWDEVKEGHRSPKNTIRGGTKGRMWERKLQGDFFNPRHQGCSVEKNKYWNINACVGNLEWTYL